MLISISNLPQSNLANQFDLAGALKSALGGGLSGAAAMVLQVLTLMVRSSSSAEGSFQLTNHPGSHYAPS